MTLNQGKRAEMSLTFGFPGLWSNPESPFLSHHHTCPFGSTPLAAQEKMQQPGSSDSRVPGAVHTLINEDKSPIVLMLRGWNDTRRKTVSLKLMWQEGRLLLHSSIRKQLSAHFYFQYPSLHKSRGSTGSSGFTTQTSLLWNISCLLNGF